MDCGRYVPSESLNLASCEVICQIIAAARERESLHSIAINEAIARKKLGSRRLTLGVDMRCIFRDPHNRLFN